MPILNADAVRNAFICALGAGSTEGLIESILIRDGTYCGRHWKAAGYSLTWFIEEQQVKFYSPQKTMIFGGSAYDFVYGEQNSRAAA